MSFDLSEEERMIAETARRAVARFDAEYWRDCDTRKAFPIAFWKEICASGLGGVNLPTEFGGSGLGLRHLALVVEETAAVAGGSTVAQLFMLNPIFGGITLSLFGSEAQKASMLPPLISGDLMFCMALTEPDAGSNSLAMKSFAARDGDGWRLNGTKIWISGVDVADKILVVARTRHLQDVERRTDGISLFVIDADRTGITHQPIEKLGTNTIASSSLFFEDVEVRPDELVGTLDRGWHQLLDVLNTERVVTTAGLVATVQLAISKAVAYGNDRRVFGNVPISAYQGLQFPLAQAHAEAEAARLMNRKSAWLFDRSEPYGSEANIAKLIAAQAASNATERAMQMMGGMGYAKDSDLERLWRDCRLFRFAPVAEEMVLNYIAVHDLGMARGY